MEPDFSGYVTRYGVRCSDGRVIQKGAFKHQDGLKVPLVYMHKHDDISQVLGYTILKHMDDGIWGDSYLNSSAKAQDAKAAVQHGDIDMYSIWAKDLEEQLGRGESLVHDGVIQETSLVLAGANSGANIYNVLAHGEIDDDNIMVVVGGEITHSEGKELKHAEGEQKPEEKPEEKPAEQKPEEKPDGDKTQADVLNSLSEEQQAAVNQYIEDLVPELLTEALSKEPELTHSDTSKKGNQMSRNAFDRSNAGKGGTAVDDRPQIKHDDMNALLAAAKGPSGAGGEGATSSFKALVRSQKATELMHADTYGIENIEILFPDAQALMNTPKFIDRRQDWVKTFMNGTSHSPFSRVKTMYADITADEARARGYIKAHEKVEEVFPVFKRTTGPALIYKKQKLDRQDIIDITDFDVVAWMKVEMRGKLDEEIARAGLFGDGRPVMINGELNPDKIQEPTGTSGDGIRSIYNDDDLYSTRYYVPLPADPSGTDYNVLLDTVTEAQEFYLGSGNKTAFMSYRVATRLLTMRDQFDKRIYRNLQEVAADMDVNRIERVPTELMPEGCLAIVLDLADYNFGTDRGGELTFFDDFDIDFNQYKYLYEVYLSGALTLPYAAQIFMAVDADTNTLVEPVAPEKVDNVITVPTVTGLSYTRTDTGATVAGGSTITLDPENLKQVTLEAHPTAGYYVDTDADVKDTFTFRYSAPSS